MLGSDINRRSICCSNGLELSGGGNGPFPGNNPKLQFHAQYPRNRARTLVRQREGEAAIPPSARGPPPPCLPRLLGAENGVWAGGWREQSQGAGGERKSRNKIAQLLSAEGMRGRHGGSARPRFPQPMGYP